MSAWEDQHPYSSFDYWEDHDCEAVVSDCGSIERRNLIEYSRVKVNSVAAFDVLLEMKVESG